MFGYSVEIVKRNEQHWFQVLTKRWIVERTFAWLNWSRRLCKDYELRPSSAEAMTYIAFAHLLLRRSTWFLDRFFGSISVVTVFDPTTFAEQRIGFVKLQQYFFRLLDLSILWRFVFQRLAVLVFNVHDRNVVLMVFGFVNLSFRN
jgi:hypothetical protein